MSTLIGTSDIICILKENTLRALSLFEKYKTHTYDVRGMRRNILQWRKIKTKARNSPNGDYWKSLWLLKKSKLHCFQEDEHNCKEIMVMISQIMNTSRIKFYENFKTPNLNFFNDHFS